MVLAWIKETRTDFYYQNARQLISYETEQEKQISNKTNLGIPKKNWFPQMVNPFYRNYYMRRVKRHLVQKAVPKSYVIWFNCSASIVLHPWKIVHHGIILIFNLLYISVVLEIHLQKWNLTYLYVSSSISKT